ncbi:murein biosynthesis integral membrane protein MurJ [Enemella evansiae]|uniref:murein biosynthesis integral membrane protein MurJ n=1 Tax=Enemella evansiae TaxID=2016499 RepID=UPI000B96C88C|nr:murein biosynthesis integral membrane protein MurJ [Enemella evansiae]OYO02426.1 murein biosynthesis integral membrane protein MurJ [Enemella evansiae]
MNQTAQNERASTSRLLSAGALMAGGTMVSRVLGFVRVALLAYVLGNGTRQADAYAVATTVPNALYILFAGGALNTVLVPQLVRAVKNDPDKGEAYTNRIMTAFLLIIGVVAVLLTIATPAVTWLYSDGQWKQPELADHYRAMVLLAYFCLPEIFFYGVFYLLGQVLNARDKFGPMMWAPIANNVVQLGVLGVYLALWGQTGGTDPFSGPQIWLLGGGHLLGIIFQTAVMVWALRKIDYRYRPRFDLKGTGLGHTFQLAKWTLGFVLVNQLALVVVTKLATSATAQGDGAGLTVYNNAYLIFVLPHSLITISLATAMLPSASRLAANGDLAGVGRETLRTINLTTTLLLPAAAAFIALAGPLTGLMFGQGQGAQDAGYVAWTLIAFAVGLVPFTVQYICLRAFYALEDTRATFVQQCLIAGLNIGFALLLVVPVHRPEWVAPALALSYSLAYLIGVGVSYQRLMKRLPGLSPAPVLRHLLRVGLAVAPAAVAAWFITQRITGGIGMQVLGLLVAGLVAVGLFLGLAKLLKIGEVTSMVSMVLRRGRTPQPATPAAEDPSTTPAEVGAETPEDDVTAIRELADPDATRIRSLGEDSPRSLSEERTESPRSLSEERTESPRSLSEERTDESKGGFDSYLAQPTDDEPTEPVENTAEDVHPIQVRSGMELGGRYRLEEVLVRRANTQTWKAFDEVLSRPVLIHLLPPGGDNDDLMNAARKAAVATDSRFLRVLDAAPDPAPGTTQQDDDGTRLGPYIVCEYAAGQSLQTLLAAGPLSALEAAWLVREVADALSGMHVQGLFHQRISPDTVIITATGNIKIVGFLLEAEMVPSHHEIAAGEDPETVDVMDLGRLLYCTLVSRWPGGHAYGMPEAPMDAERRILTPRQVRAGVSPALDRICDQILSESPRHREVALRTANEVVVALTRVLGTADAAHDLERRMRYPVPVVQVDGEEPPLASPAALSPGSAFAEQDTAAIRTSDPDAPTGAYQPISTQRIAAVPATPRTPDDAEQTVVRGVPAHGASPAPTRRRENRAWLGWLIGLVLLVLVGSLIAVALRQNPAAGPGAAPSPVPTPTQWQIVRAADFDPQGDDRTENPGQVPQAYDNNPDTAWRTVNYREAEMSDKDGLGIVFDLGEVRPIARAELQLVGAPTAVELRIPAANPETVTAAPMNSAAQWRSLAQTRATTPQVTLAPAQPVRSRFVLVYLTELPADGSTYRGGIAEARFVG